MMILTGLSKPAVKLGKMIFGRHHAHDGSLRGMNVTETKEKKGFIEYFIKVALSSEKDGGWDVFHKPVKRWTDFFAYSQATVEFRNSEGNGPVDEYRIKYEVQAPEKLVMDYALNKNRDKRFYEKETHLCGNHTSKVYKQYYAAEAMRGSFFADRDMLVEEFNGETIFEGETVSYIVRRSIENEEMYPLKQTTKQMKRVRANVIMAGYVFIKRGGGIPGDESTSVLYLENIDWGGAFQGLLMSSIVPSKLRMKTDDILAHADEAANSSTAGDVDFSKSFGEVQGDEGRGRSSSGFRDVFSGFKTSLGWGNKEKTLAIDNGRVKELELRNMYCGDNEDGNITNDNPMHGKRPPTSFPPSDREGYSKNVFIDFKQQQNRNLRSVSGETSTDKKQIFVYEGPNETTAPEEPQQLLDFRRPRKKDAGNNGEKSLAPHIARSESGGYNDTKSLRAGNKGRKGKKTGPNRESIKPPPLKIKKVANEKKAESSRWSTEFDEASGASYYYDKNTHETTWEKPDDL